MAKKKVTLSIEDTVYDTYKDLCEKNAIMLSKRIELFMEDDIRNIRSKR